MKSSLGGGRIYVYVYIYIYIYTYTVLFINIYKKTLYNTGISYIE